jgi:hypothetical protein
LAGFFFGVTCGSGGVASIRRRVSSITRFRVSRGAFVAFFGHERSLVRWTTPMQFRPSLELYTTRSSRPIHKSRPGEARPR